MSDVAPIGKDAGSTVVEIVVAAALTLLALAMVAGDTIPALRMLDGDDEPQLRHMELVAAGELAARAVRGARPDPSGSGIGLEGQRLVLAMGDAASVALTLEDDALLVDVVGDPPGMAGITTGTLVSGLDPGRSAIILVDAGGEPAAGSTPVAAVIIVLADDASSVVRVVRPRLATALDGPTRW